MHTDIDPGARRKTFIRVYNLWRQGPAAARFTLAPRFAQLAAELLGAPADGDASAFPELRARFRDALADDLGAPKALAVLWELLRSDAGRPAAGIG